VIGEESLKRVNRAKGGDHGHGNNHAYGYSHSNGGSPVHARKAIGEVHLKVRSFVVPGSYYICSLIVSSGKIWRIPVL
jgi:hypothetical protein